MKIAVLLAAALVAFSSGQDSVAQAPNQALASAIVATQAKIH